MPARANDTASVVGARYSAINSASQCPLWAWWTYKKQVRVGQNAFAKLGIAVHELLEAYGRHCYENKLETDYDFLDLQKFKFMPMIFEEQVGDYNDIIETIKGNINWGDSLKNKVLFEERLAIDENFNAYHGKKPYFSSGIDIIEIMEDEEGPMAVVTDYKTLRSILTQQAQRESLQRQAYSALVLIHHPELLKVAFRFNFVRYGYVTPLIWMSREELPEVIERLKHEIEGFNDLMAMDEEPEACAGGHCILCDHHGVCPAYQHAFQAEDRIESHEDAVRVYMSMRIAKLRLQEMETALKNWINVNSKVRTKKEEYGPVAYEKVKYTDLVKLMEVMTKNGIPLASIHDNMSISKTAVGKLTKKFKLPKEVVEEIDKLSVKTEYTKFVAKAIEDEREEDDCEDMLEA